MDLLYQKRVANVLGKIDSKIKSNNRIIFELESMAKTLYDYWFLQFEFPNEEGKPYKSSGGKMIYNEELKREIPDGWKVENMMESSLCFDIKAGVDKLTEYTALQYGKKNIRCNCIRPGLIVTPQNEAYVPQALKDIFLDNIMVNRYGCPEDIGHLCVYLASDESAYVTGQIMNVDGGLNSHVSTVAQFKAMKSRTW